VAAAEIAAPAALIADPTRAAAKDVSVGALAADAVRCLRLAGSEQPRLDAELLLGHVLGLERTAIIAHPERPVDPGRRIEFDRSVARREAGEPVAYIRGFKEFHGLELEVDRRVLIPRPETERLVELAIGITQERLRSGGAAPAQIVDVGTGSGAIVIAVADALRRAGLLDRVRMLATDASADALSVAAANLLRHELVDPVRLVEADLLPESLPPADLLLANLPYIPSGVVPGLPLAASFEPRSALDGGPDGLAIIRRLLDRLPSALAPGGTALLEIGGDQGATVAGELGRLPSGWSGRIEMDLAGLPRVVIVRRPGEPA